MVSVCGESAIAIGPGRMLREQPILGKLRRLSVRALDGCESLHQGHVSSVLAWELDVAC